MKRPTTTLGQRVWRATKTTVTATAFAIPFIACCVAVLAAVGVLGSSSAESGNSGDDDAVKEACDYFRTEVIDREIDPKVGYEQLFDELEADLQHVQFGGASSDPYLYGTVQNAVSATVSISVAAEWAHTQEVIEGAREAGALIPSSHALTLHEALQGLDAAGDNLDQAIEDVAAACEQAES
jgi:hypothetical protein